MSSVYPKRNRLYLRLKVNGKWVGVATDFRVGQERQARALLDRLEAQREAGGAADFAAGPPTVASWLPKWVAERKSGVQTWRNDEAVMRLHVLPALGERRLDEVRPKHVVDLVRSWRARTGDEAMAPKSIYNAYSSLSAFFRDAALEDLIAATPCVLTKHQLGPKVDANPEWRATAMFSRAELELLISDARVPMDRRVYYALCGLAGLRYGEASGLLWRNTLVPVPEYPGELDMLQIAFSYGRPFPKGDVTRPVPCHPTLAALLAQWKLTGWRELFGRAPGPDDLVVPLPHDAPSKHGRWRTKDWVRRRLAGARGVSGDLEALGLRHRRGHDLRRAFISLARSAGARTEILRRVTHRPPREVIEGYTTFEWPVVCAEVLKLQVRAHGPGKVIEMPRAIAANGSTSPELATAPATAAVLSERKSSGPSRTRTGPPDVASAAVGSDQHGSPGDYAGAGASATTVQPGSEGISGSTVASARVFELLVGEDEYDADAPVLARPPRRLR